MSALASSTIELFRPVEFGGRSITSVTVREPRAGDFIRHGALTRTIKRGRLTALFDLPEIQAHYLRSGLDLPLGDVEPFLAAVSLSDTLRLIRALAALVPTIPREDVRYWQSCIVFEWHAMSLRELDEMGVSELFATVERLAEHGKRRARERERSRHGR